MPRSRGTRRNTANRKRICSEDMFASAKRARIRVCDMAHLMQVSRVTASLWFNNHAQPHRLLLERAKKILSAVDSALQAGDLPAAQGQTRTEQMIYVNKMVARHLRRLAQNQSVS